MTTIDVDNNQLSISLKSVMEIEMTKWEYCAIFRIGKDLDGVPKAISPTTLTYFLNEGTSVKPLTSNKSSDKDALSSLSQAIASLGAEGWEMVGCGNTAEGSHSIYFKRAIG